MNDFFTIQQNQSNLENKRNMQNKFEEGFSSRGNKEIKKESEPEIINNLDKAACGCGQDRSSSTSSCGGSRESFNLNRSN